MKKTICIILLIVSGFLILYPFSPQIFYKLNEKKYYESYSHFTSSNIIQSPNSLIIPQIGVSANIVEGMNENVLNKGVWHIPTTGNPLGGNMVIAGHRFLYLPPNNTTFYNLDKLNNGQRLFIIWNHQEYDYTISSIFETASDNIGILNDSSSPTLTLYTCTPLWSATKRLVIKAYLNPKS